MINIFMSGVRGYDQDSFSDDMNVLLSWMCSLFQNDSMVLHLTGWKALAQKHTHWFILYFSYPLWCSVLLLMVYGLGLGSMVINFQLLAEIAM